MYLQIETTKHPTSRRESEVYPIPQDPRQPPRVERDQSQPALRLALAGSPLFDPCCISAASASASSECSIQACVTGVHQIPLLLCAQALRTDKPRTHTTAYTTTTRSAHTYFCTIAQSIKHFAKESFVSTIPPYHHSTPQTSTAIPPYEYSIE